MIQENTNKALVYNTVILYIKLLVNTVTSLLATRFTLKAMGADDFGLFAVLGGIISIISILNTIMVSTSNRFISVAIGKNVISETNAIFNVNLLIHIAIAVITLIIALPIGHIYVNNFLNYDGDLDIALIIMYISIVGSVISFISVPHSGLLMAKENFFMLSLTDIIAHLMKLLLAYILISLEKNWVMLVYAFGTFILTILPSIVYVVYCHLKYSDITKFKLVNDKDKYKECLSFSVWVSYGAIACVAKSQGAAVLINSFFNTIMNTALSIANTVNSFIVLISQTISQPITPQITKSYAQNDISRCDVLLILSTKLTFVISFLISIPLIKETEWMLTIWLGSVPEYGVLFTRLLIIDTLITSLNSGISTIIFASGKIKFYQIPINTLRLLSLGIAYVALKMGAPAYSLLYSYIVISVMIFLSCQLVLKKTLNYNTNILWRKSYIPSIMMVVFCLPVFFVKLSSHPVLDMLLSEILSVVVGLIVILSRDEKGYLVNYIKQRMA